VAFGATAIMFPIIVILFVGYQLNQGDKNVPIDIGDFFIGYSIMMLILHNTLLKSDTIE
jgi:hypothetical protein